MKDHKNADNDAAMETAMEAAREHATMPHLRDVLKWEHDHPRPRDEAWEKWGPMIEAQIERDLERERWKMEARPPSKTPTPATRPERKGPDMEME